MSLIQALKPLLNSRTLTVDLQVSAFDANHLCVIAKPITTAVPDKADSELVQLMAGLAMPIKVIDTPDNIEMTLVREITQAVPTRNDWDARARAIEESISQKPSQAKADAKAADKPASADQTPTDSASQPASTPSQDNANATADDDTEQDELSL